MGLLPAPRPNIFIRHPSFFILRSSPVKNFLHSSLVKNEDSSFFTSEEFIDGDEGIIDGTCIRPVGGRHLGAAAPHTRPRARCAPQPPPHGGGPRQPRTHLRTIMFPRTLRLRTGSTKLHPRWSALRQTDASRLTTMVAPSTGTGKPTCRPPLSKHHGIF